MAAKAEFPCGLPGGGVASALWWMQWDVVLVVWGLAVFVEGFLLTFAGGVVILKVHIWEHSGPFGYLIPRWLVYKYGGEEPVGCVRFFLLPS